MWGDEHPEFVAVDLLISDLKAGVEPKPGSRSDSTFHRKRETTEALCVDS